MQHNGDLDFLKGIGIMFVVLGHCLTTAIVTKYSTLRIVKDIIYTFHMPLFFIVTGYLYGLRTFNLENLKKFGFHQVKKLFVPYFVWSVLLYLFYFLLNQVVSGITPEHISLNPINMVTDIMTFRVVTGNVLWFTYILFLITVISYFIHSIIKSKALNIMFIIIVFLFGYLANIYIPNEIIVIKLFLVMWIYYEIGMFIGIYVKDINLKANALIITVLVGLYAGFSIWSANLSGIFARALDLLCTLIAVFIFYSLSKYNNSRFYRFFNYLGKKTMYIYYLHNPYIVLILVTALTTYTQINVIAAVTASLFFGIMIPLAVGEVLNRISVIKLVLFGEARKV